MKRKNILRVLSAAGVMAAIGLSIPMTQNVYASPTTVRLANQNTQESTYQREIPKSWYGTTQEFGGLSLTISQEGKVTANAVSNPESVTELLLYAQLGNGAVDYSNLTLKYYTNVQDIVIVANDVSTLKELLVPFEHFTNLYVSGSLNFAETLPNINCDNIYLCYTYVPYTLFSSKDFTNYINTSKIKHIYYNNFCLKYLESNITSFNGSYTNINGEAITMEPISGNLKYPEEVFYPCSDFNTRSSYLGCTSYFRASNANEILNASSLTERIEAIDDEVEDFVYEGTATTALIKEHSYGTLVLPNVLNYNLNGFTAKEVVVPINNNKSIDVNYLTNIETLRFLPQGSGGLLKITTTQYDESSGTNLKQILIPKGYESSFTNLTSREDLTPIIEYYDPAEYSMPTSSSFKYNEEAIRCSGGYTIEEAKEEVERLKALGIDYKSIAVEYYSGSLYLQILDEIQRVYTIVNPDLADGK